MISMIDDASSQLHARFVLHDSMEENNFGAYNRNASRFGAWRVLLYRIRREELQDPRPRGAGIVFERRFPPAVVLEQNLQASAIGRSCSRQSGSGASDSEKMSARTNGRVPWRKRRLLNNIKRK
jgi:hypothetical protein